MRLVMLFLFFLPEIINVGNNLFHHMWRAFGY